MALNRRSLLSGEVVMREPLVDQGLDFWDVQICMRAEGVHVCEHLEVVCEIAILCILCHREGKDAWLGLLQVVCRCLEGRYQLRHVSWLCTTTRRYEDRSSLDTGAILFNIPSNGPGKGELGSESFHSCLNMLIEASVNCTFEGCALVVAAYPSHELVLSLGDAHVDVRIEGFHVREPLDVMHQHLVIRVWKRE